jgi:hypothetical protein
MLVKMWPMKEHQKAVLTFRPVLLSSSTRARWAIPPPFYAALLLAGKLTAASVSAI